jgi:hypothetical protein
MARRKTPDVNLQQLLQIMARAPFKITDGRIAELLGTQPAAVTSWRNGSLNGYDVAKHYLVLVDIYAAARILAAYPDFSKDVDAALALNAAAPRFENHTLGYYIKMRESVVVRDILDRIVHGNGGLLRAG